MKFKFNFNFKDFFLHLATAAAIIASIIMWIGLMTNTQSFNQISNKPSAQSSDVASHYRNLKNFYAPSHVYTFIDGIRYQVYDSKKNLPLKFTQSFENAKLGSITRVSTSQERYKEMIDDHSFVQFAYPDQIDFTVLIGTNKKRNADKQFNRVFIPNSSDHHYVYFGNDIGNRLYRMNIIKGDFSKLAKYVNKAEDQTEVSFLHLHNLYVPAYSQPLSVREYSYLVSYHSGSYYASKLLGNGYKRSVSNNTTTYRSGYSDSLQVPKKNSNHQYYYNAYQKQGRFDFSRQLLEGVTYIRKIGLSEQDLRFFEANDNSVQYVNYIEGLPAFLNAHDPQAGVTFSKETINVNFNSTDLEIPIPFDGRTKTLPSTRQLLRDLAGIGIKRSSIQRIIVGYSVKKDKSRGDLVNLVPTYYIKVNNVWNSLSGWEKEYKTSSNASLSSSKANSYANSTSSSSSSDSTNYSNSSTSSSQGNTNTTNTNGANSNITNNNAYDYSSADNTSSESSSNDESGDQSSSIATSESESSSEEAE